MPTYDGWPDCVQIWCVFINQLAITFAQVRGGVHLHVRTCTPLFHTLQTADRIPPQWKSLKIRPDWGAEWSGECWADICSLGWQMPMAGFGRRRAGSLCDLQTITVSTADNHGAPLSWETVTTDVTACCCHLFDNSVTINRPWTRAGRSVQQWASRFTISVWVQRTCIQARTVRRYMCT